MIGDREIFQLFFNLALFTNVNHPNILYILLSTSFFNE